MLLLHVATKKRHQCRSWPNKPLQVASATTLPCQPSFQRKSTHGLERLPCGARVKNTEHSQTIFFFDPGKALRCSFFSPHSYDLQLLRQPSLWSNPLISVSVADDMKTLDSVRIKKQAWIGVFVFRVIQVAVALFNKRLVHSQENARQNIKRLRNVARARW